MIPLPIKSKAKVSINKQSTVNHHKKLRNQMRSEMIKFLEAIFHQPYLNNQVRFIPRSLMQIISWSLQKSRQLVLVLRILQMNRLLKIFEESRFLQMKTGCITMKERTVKIQKNRVQHALFLIKLATQSVIFANRTYD